MNVLISILSLFGFLSNMTLAAYLPNGSIPPRSMGDMTISKMTFEGSIGDYKVQLNGSIQEIHAQMKAIYPDFDPDTAISNQTLDIRHLGKRSKMQPPLCYPVQDWGRAETAPINTGIRYLNQVQALCGVGANSCVRVSCSYRAAIYLCNDNDYGITPTCPYIASYAQDIINSCNYHRPGGNTWDWSVCGQEFDTDNYNVIVRWDNSDGC
ncbi:uncharacterized protein LY89DRAFT_726918 [Mollisia scopiformis]|uniref:Uncharacterized protein n=1 Tax=Mollisia scopiformis TaxID=149040 RepID=A0A194XV03_MOLSC|nr:uncharacterized protein LY89DRAFT_726918 [Mollisia scopiformis]KUJ23864.1 hypothetical protein LY89DRAFT_726918 [Mollisia scopiformis]